MNEETNIIEEFNKQYDIFVKQLKTTKSKFRSPQTIEIVRNTIQLLLKIAKQGKLNELDSYMVYNTLLLCNKYLKIVPEPMTMTPIKINLLTIREELLHLKELGISKENYSSRR